MSQRVRRNESPTSSTSGPPGMGLFSRLLPLKATVPFQLRAQTQLQTRAPSPPSPPVLPHARAPSYVPPTPQRWSPEQEARPNSPVSREKTRPATVAPLPGGSPSSNIRRTSSLDTLATPYLSGQWPRDGSNAQCMPCMKNKATQTPSAWAEECSEKRRGSHKRSASWGSSDQLKEIAKLRQQLQRSKHSSRQQREKDRKSPFNGSHSAVIQTQVPIPKSILIPIPISKTAVSRFRNSVEGLNQEIERIIIRDTTGERDELLIAQDIPDGHRAPPPISHRSSSTRNIDTQTPSGSGGGGGNHSNSSSRSHSISPTYLTVTPSETGGCDSPCSGEDLQRDGLEKDLCPNSPLPKYASSPKPNNSYMFKREPPEGCERVKVFEEMPPRPAHEIPQFLCPDRNKVNFIPKSGSAFCLVSILKPLLVPQEQEQRVSRGTSTGSQQHSLPRHVEEPES